MSIKTKSPTAGPRRSRSSSAALAALIALALAAIGCVSTSSEEALIWCGPATAEMIIENDTRSGCPSSVLQEDLWTIIEANRVDPAWHTDPVGMEKALEQSCTGWSWMPISDPDPASFMHSVAYFMHKYDYPAALVLDTLPHASYPAHAEHWVDVLGVVTDQDPTTASGTVTLEYVLYVDPSPPTLGDNAIIELVSGSAWFARLSPVDKVGSSYHGKHVAVIEPPETKGVVKARVQPTRGEIMPPDQAVDMAMHRLEKLMADQRTRRVLERHDLTRVIKEYGLPARRPLENLERARPLEPMLVNRSRNAYYIVPLAFEGSRFENLAQAAVAINAFDGSFQEMGLFKPTLYASEKRILDAARKLPRIGDQKILDLELVHPRAGHGHRLMPVWSVRTERQRLLLDNDGRLIKTSVPVKPTHLTPIDPTRRIDQRPDRVRSIQDTEIRPTRPIAKGNIDQKH